MGVKQKQCYCEVKV